MLLRSGGIFDEHFVTNLLLSLSVKEFENYYIWQSCRQVMAGKIVCEMSSNVSSEM